MDEDMDRLQSIAAKSNLVATAGEFIPKSLANTQKFGQREFQNVYNLSGSSNSNNISFQAQTFNDANGAVTESSSNISCSLNLPPVSQCSVAGECSNSGRNFSKSAYKNNNVFLPNRDYRFFRHNQNRLDNRWKRSTLGESFNTGNEQWNEKDSNQYERKNFRSNNQVKSNNFNSTTKSKFLEKPVATHSQPENQQNNFLEQENLSWRYKDKPGKAEGQEESFSNFKQKQRIKGKTFVENEENANKKVGAYKSGNHNSHKEYHYKNTSATHGNIKHFDLKIKEEKKYSADIAQATSQREQLIDMLSRGVLECLVCCEIIYQNHSVWSCSNCHHVLHLKCVIKWAKSSKSDFGWRCPACQNVTNKVPYDYYCFCGKVRDPEWNHQDCPHSCGEVCGKSYRKSCPHKCTLLCHPGPCPQCTATITKTCGCQKTSKTVQCCSSEMLVCNEICGKQLNCLIHTCMKNCHMGKCEECSEFIIQNCFCQKNNRKTNCTVESLKGKDFSCGELCEKKLSCGNHFCQLYCHEGECPNCEMTPDLIKFCPCGQTELTSLSAEKRTSCIDPIPTCDLTCSKPLKCGPTDKPHTCRLKCHEGACPDCLLETLVKCRCGHKDKVVPCAELNTQTGDILCDKRCSKKRSCGKHKCNQVCCTGIDHDCPLLCNRFLQCGLHRCEETCHKGHCKPCLRASFEELPCECGAEIIFPPVPCGTRRPLCDRPCIRTHECDHPPVHNCHSAPQCPPCTVLTKKYCHGRHELRKAVPCHQDSFSCGLPCGKDLDCGKHKCILPCHSGPCLKPEQTCVQPCTIARPACGHICGVACHEGPCPVDIPCKEMVRVTCECGHRFTTKGCHDNAKEFQRIATAKLARKMTDLQSGQTIDLNDVVSASKKLSYKTLECNDECKLIERNRRLAIALQIRNPDLSAKLTPRYSEYLKTWAKRDARFCQMVHDKLTDLVQLAKQSKQKSRSYSFDSMNREKRHFIHEYCEHFGCESVAYDQEPKRNVVATALKDKSWLPSLSIIEFIQKENSPRKVPAPVITKINTSTPQTGMETLSSKILASSQQYNSNEGMANSSAKDPEFDYFDGRP